MTEELSSVGRHRQHWQTKGIIGVPWEESGIHQFSFLKANGLQCYHKLLDIGCSCLRGGIHFIDYLDEGHYYGFDKEPELIGFARDEIRDRGLRPKSPTVETVSDFDMSFIEDVKFDFMFAQSVFTHLSPYLVRLCFERVMPRLKQNGKFFATIHEGFGSVGLSVSKEAHSWRKTGDERKQVFYSVDYITNIADHYDMELTYIGQWGPPADGIDCPLCKRFHPDNTDQQTMLLFTKQVREL